MVEQMNGNDIMTENGITTLPLLIEADECDTAAMWRPSVIVTAMQRATHYAREALGIDWSALAAKGALWVVSRVNVSFERIPKMGEKLTLRAIPQKPVKALYPWRFEFSDNEGKQIGTGETLWNLMDADTRRLAILPEVAETLLQAGITEQGALPSAAQELDGEPRRLTFTPAYTDLDINGHASHLRYIDWCCNIFGAGIMSRYAIPRFRIAYMHEVRTASSADIELRTRGTSFSFSGYYGDTPAFVIDGTLAARE